ncbi:9261_t:CDS:2 [Ambispora leptoticha]|uniref:9261_t:CDS:1 n=1 Tax=Ambispora leptoticha TaxID=144679 RepID=A0A9N8ZUD3_9GLOM|nr:9261_t:CDS:2 [Ambispora leptoticha]
MDHQEIEKNEKNNDKNNNTPYEVIPDDVRAYRDKEYWNMRYQKRVNNQIEMITSEFTNTRTFDWFKTYKDLKPLFNAHLTRNSPKILMLGCGNSTLSEDLYDDNANYHQITNIDFSDIVIDQMYKRCHETHKEMQWLVMDVRDLKFPDASFDYVIDKGTMDALMCDKGDVWNPDEDVVENVKKEVDEVVRVLKPGGKFIYITFGQPHFRRRHLERDCWKVEVETFGEVFHYFFYLMTKMY